MNGCSPAVIAANAHFSGGNPNHIPVRTRQFLQVVCLFQLVRCIWQSGEVHLVCGKAEAVSVCVGNGEPLRIGVVAAFLYIGIRNKLFCDFC